MKFENFFRFITSVSTPIGGISWTIPESDKDIAQRVVKFLKQRRVLFEPFHLENPIYAMESIIEIKHYLTSEIMKATEDGKLIYYLQEMNTACNAFLTKSQQIRITTDNLWNRELSSKEVSLFMSLNILRKIFACDVCMIVQEFKIKEDTSFIKEGVFFNLID